MAKLFLSVIIPAYNEAKRLPLTLIDVDRHLSEQNFSYEIIVAMSPSTDDTASILARFTHLIKKLRVVSLTENKGKGFALKEGLKQARGVWSVCMDADNAITIVEFIKMIPYLKQRGEGEEGKELYEVVIGSRRIKGAYLNPAPPLGSNIAGIIGSFFLRVFIARDIHDMTSGFICFSSEVVEKIIPRSIMNHRSTEIELIKLALLNGYPVKEVPIFYSHDPHSSLSMGERVKLSIEVLRISVRSLMGGYTK